MPFTVSRHDVGIVPYGAKENTFFYFFKCRK